MAINIGTQLGSYEITALLGKGGMGEVYRARDNKLKRDVAIKVLPEEFSRDPERLARSQREAEVLAALNHPHIAQIYGQEESGSTRCLVLEYVDGETLQEKIKRGPLPMEDALEIARQIAMALEAAHERGIVHRDLKPANVKITPSGDVKVLDFGLAKMLTVEPLSGISQSPTLLASGTAEGVILGTTAYMSPEQAKGKTADARSDIWALGVVLYEMMTGHSAFTGETTVEVLGGVLKSDPDWTALPDGTSPILRSLLRRCLQKDRNRRFRDAADVRIQIEEALGEPGTAGADAKPVRKSRTLPLWITVSAVAMIALATVSILYLRLASVEAPEMRLQIVTPAGANLYRFAISPDGSKVVFGAFVNGRNQLWVRPIDSEVAQPLAETVGGGGAGNPYLFWSPDSRSIGFSAGGALKRIDLADGRVQTLSAGVSGCSAGSWNNDGTILYARTCAGPLYRVPSGGGEAMEVTHVDPPKQAGHVYPQFLSDGRHFLFFSFGARESQGVYMGSLDSPQAVRLLDADAAAVFLPPDQILFARQGALLAQRLNARTLQLDGEPRTVASHVAVDIVNGVAAVSSSATGLVAYRAGAEERQVLWISRTGQQMGTVTGPDATLQGTNMRLSPDGLTLALSRTVGGNTDVWLVETLRGVLRRFTIEAANETAPLWSPDGTHIIFTSDPKGVMNIYEKPLNGNGPAELLIESSQDKATADWSPDGRFILYRERGTNTGNDLWVHCLAIRNRSRSRKPHSTKGPAGFHRTAAGSPINRTKLDRMKSMSSRFSAQAASFRSQAPAGHFRSGAAMDVSCSTLPRTIA
jgi:eukaryotic-like serine/threonine-protein kinase